MGQLEIEFIGTALDASMESDYTIVTLSVLRKRCGKKGRHLIGCAPNPFSLMRR
jgi:hypothetical protein